MRHVGLSLKHLINDHVDCGFESFTIFPNIIGVSVTKLYNLVLAEMGEVKSQESRPCDLSIDSYRAYRKEMSNM